MANNKSKVFEWVKTRRRWGIILLIVPILLWSGYLRFIKGYPWADNTGFENKTLWDWLELLIVPAVLAFIAYLFNKAERKAERETEEKRAETEREIAADRWQETAMQSYLDNMTNLILERGLLSSEKDSEVRHLVRARTLTVLPILDKKRQRVLLHFLYEAKLISADDPIVSLSMADLQEADLAFALLRGASLRGANLQRANLKGADLISANLRMADLHGAVLSLANMQLANLQKADLFEAIIAKAHLNEADLTETNLHKAILKGSDLSKALLRGTNLTQTNLEKVKLTSAIIDDNVTVDDTIMPDGKISSSLSDLRKFTEMVAT